MSTKPDSAALRIAMQALQRTEPTSDACRAAQRAYAASTPAKRDTHKTIFLLGAVFSCDGPGAKNYAIVTDGQDVRVYDSVAHAMTTCHSLTPEQVERIRTASDYSTITL